jgi:hypothetical protein
VSTATSSTAPLAWMRPPAPVGEQGGARFPLVGGGVTLPARPWLHADLAGGVAQTGQVTFVGASPPAAAAVRRRVRLPRGWVRRDGPPDLGNRSGMHPTPVLEATP